MHMFLRYSVLPLIFTLFSIFSFGQDYSFGDFVGTWQGTIYSNYAGTLQTTMTINENGFYTESSGFLMPTLYPNTQQCEYQGSTNRMHWWYLQTVYAGQYFYQHYFYEVVSFENGVLEMHYNYWDDPMPHPEVGTISLVRVTSTPAPINIEVDYIDDLAVLSWDEPNNGNNPIADLLGYNVYGSYEMGEYELIVFTEDIFYSFENGAAAGLHSFHVTAVYDEGESFPSDEIAITFTTPEPEMLSGEAIANYIELNWSAPTPENGPLATLLGYNVFHKFENEEFELVAFVESTYFTHENLMSGTHYYYTTAVYDGGESGSSNEVEASILTTSVEDNLTVSTQIYPNPATDFIFLETTGNVRNVRLMNQAGQLLLLIESPRSNQRIDVSSLSLGTYILMIETDAALTSHKVMIE
jgi:hypothetical protein